MSNKKDKMIDILTLHSLLTSNPEPFNNIIEAIGEYMNTRAEIECAVAEFEGKNGEID